MGIAADDLDRAKDAKLRMADLGVGRCHSSRRSPFLCRRPQHHQPDGRRQQLVAAGLGEGVLIPARKATARIAGERKQPLGIDTQAIYQVPHVHRGRPAVPRVPHRILDAGDRSRRSVRSLRYQLDGILASYLPVEAALCADQAVWLPPHDRRLSDLPLDAVSVRRVLRGRPAALQTAMAQVGLWWVTCGDARGARSAAAPRPTNVPHGQARAQNDMPGR